jgi:hypothetical protein
MAATPSIKVTKSFTYRGVSRTFSNRYHFAGGTPADNAHWTTLSDAIVTAEKACHFSTIVIVGTTGYAAGSEVPVFSKTYSTAGTLASGGFATPGDVAALVRYSTAVRTAKNHPVYLFNYYHGVATIGGTSNDLLLVAQATAFGTYASTWIGAGFSDGATAYHRAGPNGATATGQIVEAFLTHRDLPR